MTVDWARGMTRTFAFVAMDRRGWSEEGEVGGVLSATIVRSSEERTCGHAAIKSDADIGERYIRIYMDVRQGSERARLCMGTFLAQGASASHNGKMATWEADCYSPLVELADDRPPIGWHWPQTASAALGAVADHMAAPLSLPPSYDALLATRVFSPDDTWLDVAEAVASATGFRLAVSEYGTVGIEAVGGVLSPVYTFAPGDGSMLLPGAKATRDVWASANTVEVVHGSMRAVAVNDDPDSALSTVSRGRTVLRREVNPDIAVRAGQSAVTQADVQAHADALLDAETRAERRCTIRHGFVPIVRPNVAVRLLYGGLDVVGRVVSQSIRCDAACTCETEISWTEAV